MADPALNGEIRAAGAVLWRPSGRGREVALIHRPRYDDWSFPKGKLERGEHRLLAAVREVAEETGVHAILGRPLPTSHYDRGGRPKRVDYWAGRPASDGQQPFRANKEVDGLEWLPVPVARGRLSYSRDAAILDEFAAGPADTVPLTFLRHASAGTKHDWTGDDLYRPLDAEGTAESELLAGLLSCFGPARVISSAAERCVASVRPYATATGAKVEIEPAFTVGRAEAEPAAAAARVADIVHSGEPAVICAHRENLPPLLTAACAALGAEPPDDGPLGKGGFWVLHTADGLLAAAEQHDPAEPGPGRLEMSDVSSRTGYVQTPPGKGTDMADNVADAVEAELAELSWRLTEPGQRECLRCFLLRMISEFGCDGTHRWTVRWRNLRAPRATGLVQRMQRRGGCCCDCEVIFNVFPDYPETDEILPCAGVLRAGSAVPCDLRSLRKSA